MCGRQWEGVLYLLEMLDRVPGAAPCMREAVGDVRYLLELLEGMCCVPCAGVAADCVLRVQGAEGRALCGSVASILHVLSCCGR